MKRFIISVIFICLSISFIGCGESNSNNSSVSKNDNSIPKFDGLYIETNDGKFLELSAQTLSGYYKGGNKFFIDAQKFPKKILTLKQSDFKQFVLVSINKNFILANVVGPKITMGSSQPRYNSVYETHSLKRMHLENNVYIVKPTDSINKGTYLIHYGYNNSYTKWLFRLN